MFDHLTQNAHAIDHRLTEARIVAVLEEQDTRELDARTRFTVAVVHLHHVAFADLVLARAILKNCIHIHSTVAFLLGANEEENLGPAGKCNNSRPHGTWPDAARFFGEATQPFLFHASTIARNAAICAGVVPQQPPTMRTPTASNSGSRAAIASGVCG